MADNDRKITTTWTVIDKASGAFAAIETKLKAVKSAFSQAGPKINNALSNFSGGKLQAAQAAVTNFGNATNSVWNRLFAQRNALGQFRQTGWNAAKTAITNFTNQATADFGKLGFSMSSVTAMFPGLKLALSGVGVAFAAAGVASLGDQFEKTQLQLAGFLTGLGRTANIDQGLSVAAVTMERIRIAAALLPGEAEDYIEVFKAGLPVINTAIGGTMKNLTDFSNRFTAVTNTLGVDSAQAGRDLNLMLQAGAGRAGVAVKSFARMLPFMRQIEGQADLNAKAFNQMSQSQRADLMIAAMAKLQPMLDRAATSFDAMKGAAISNVKHITRLATMPLFEGMKAGLGAFNNALADNEGTLTSLGNRLVNFGKLFSAGVVSGVNVAVEAIRKLYGWFERLAASPAAQKIGDSLAAVGSRIGNAASSFSQGGGAMGAAAGGVAMALGGVSAPIAAAIAVFVELADRGTFLADTFGQIVSFAGMLIVPLTQFANAMGTAVVLVADLFQSALPGVINAFTAITEPVILFVGHAFALVEVTAKKLRPALVQLWTTIGGFLQSVGTFLNPVIRILGTTILFLYDKITSFLVPVLNVVVNVFTVLVKALSGLISWIGGIIGKGADALENASGRSLKSAFGGASIEERSERTSFFENFMKSLDAAQAKPTTGPDGTIVTPRERGGGGRVVQDFRFSRFDITQKFEDAVNPDRLAVMFTREIARIGEQKAQSVFDPIFGVGS